MKKHFALLALAVALPVSAQTAIKVNGAVIPAQEQADLMKLLEANGITDSKKKLEAAQSILVREKVIEQEAKKLKLTQDPVIKRLTAENANKILTEALARKFQAEHPLSDKEIQDTYYVLKRQYNPTEVQIRHVLVKTPKEANDILYLAQAGDKMADLAKKYSIDAATAKNGGQIPFTNVNSFNIPNLAGFVMEMKKGEVLNKPIQSKWGYHIIQLEDKRQVPYPEFKDIKDQVAAQAMQMKVNDYFTKLFSSARIDTGAKGAKGGKK